MENSDKNLKKLLKQLHVYGRQADEIASEINAGDELLRQYHEPKMPDHLAAQIEQTIRSQGVTHTRKTRYLPRQILAAAAAIAIAVLAVSAIWLSSSGSNQNTTVDIAQTYGEMDLFDDDEVLWELALKQQETEKIDELVLTEVLMLWDDQEEPLDNLLGEVSWKLNLNYC